MADLVEKLRRLHVEGYTRAQRLRYAYRTVFGGLEAPSVLVDLARRCSAMTSTFSNDPVMMAFREGQRSVFLHIQTMIHMDETRLRALLEQESDEEIE